MGQELEHYFCSWSLHSLQLGQRLNVNPMEAYQGSVYRKLISLLGYFPACILIFLEVMNLMNYCAVIGFHSNCGI